MRQPMRSPRSQTRQTWFVFLALAVLPLTARSAEPPRLDWLALEAKLAQENARLTQKNPDAADAVIQVVCTLYYTPRESGITAERGFDLTPETAPGLPTAFREHRFARDFLRAVRLEGFGRLQTALDGQDYLHYEGHGRFSLTTRPTGRGGLRPLVASHTCAARGGPGATWRTGESWRLECAEIHAAFFPGSPSSDAGIWTVADTGEGLHRWQLDLYWGEDDPRGPGADLARPLGSDFQWAFARARRSGG